MRGKPQATLAITDHFVRAIVVIGIAMTFAGFLAFVFPYAELANHFRPFTLAGCLFGLALALPLRRATAAFCLALLAATNTAVLLAVTTYAAPIAAPQSGRILKLITFNVFSANARLQDAARWIVAEAPDIVVLQEMTSRSKPNILPALRSAFPHIYDCECNDIVIASKLPWTGAGGQTRTAALPSWSWIDVADGKLGKLRIIGLRPYYPYRSSEQAVQYSWIETQLANLQQPTIVIGDFNLTPWSWKLLRLNFKTGLLRHGTWARSWPAQDNWPNIPAFLIDNVLSSPEIKSITFSSGPHLGSDHLPVVAVVRLP